MIYGNKFLNYGITFEQVDLFLKESYYNDSKVFSPLFEGCNVVFLDEASIIDTIKKAFGNIRKIISIFFRKIRYAIETKFKKLKLRKEITVKNNYLKDHPIHMDIYNYYEVFLDIMDGLTFTNVQNIVGSIVDKSDKKFSEYSKHVTTSKQYLQQQIDAGDELAMDIKHANEFLNKTLNGDPEKRSNKEFWDDINKYIDDKIVNGFPGIIISGALIPSMPSNCDIERFKKDFTEYFDKKIEKSRKGFIFDSVQEIEKELYSLKVKGEQIDSMKNSMFKILDKQEKALNAALKDIENMQSEQKEFIIQDSGFVSFLNKFKSAIAGSLLPAISFCTAKITEYYSKHIAQINAVADGNKTNQNK